MMSNWTPADWTMFFVALGTFVNTALIALAAFIANLAKLRSETNAKKIDENTVLTKAGTAQAATNASAAKVAAIDAKDAATDAKEAAVDFAKQMNGLLDERISKIVTRHLDPIEKNMIEIRQMLANQNKDRR